jgi:hypothetical protein
MKKLRMAPGANSTVIRLDRQAQTTIKPLTQQAGMVKEVFCLSLT